MAYISSGTGNIPGKFVNNIINYLSSGTNPSILYVVGGSNKSASIQGNSFTTGPSASGITDAIYIDTSATSTTIVSNNIHTTDGGTLYPITVAGTGAIGMIIGNVGFSAYTTGSQAVSGNI